MDIDIAANGMDGIQFEKKKPNLQSVKLLLPKNEKCDAFSTVITIKSNYDGPKNIHIKGKRFFDQDKDKRILITNGYDNKIISIISKVCPQKKNDNTSITKLPTPKYITMFKGKQSREYRLRVEFSNEDDLIKLVSYIQFYNSQCDKLKQESLITLGDDHILYKKGKIGPIKLPKDQLHRSTNVIKLKRGKFDNTILSEEETLEMDNKFNTYMEGDLIPELLTSLKLEHERVFKEEGINNYFNKVKIVAHYNWGVFDNHFNIIFPMIAYERGLWDYICKDEQGWKKYLFQGNEFTNAGNDDPFKQRYTELQIFKRTIAPDWT